MNYRFPIINNIDDVIPHIKDSPEFHVTDKGTYSAINYNLILEDTFPEVIPGSEDEVRNAIRRECRGIIFDNATGEIIRRPFHKFFNINERRETQFLELGPDNLIMDKLDGSMIAPFFTDDRIIFGTKAGETEVSKQAQEFAENNPEYIDFSGTMIRFGMTPIFEWCSNQQRIVLDNEEDQLILTAIRSMRDGRYYLNEEVEYVAKSYNIPTVKTFDFGNTMDMKSFISYTSGLEDVEGFVTRYPNGHMVKSKCDWYIRQHRAIDGLKFEKDVIRLVIEDEVDDVIPILIPELADKLKEFQDAVNSNILKTATIIYGHAYYLREVTEDRKSFAKEVGNKNNMKYFYFKAYENMNLESIISELNKYIMANVKTATKVESIRHIIGDLKWER